jgi:ParB-like chromosome segregation protein Spo0J
MSSKPIRKPLTVPLSEVDTNGRLLPLREEVARELATSMSLHDQAFHPVGIRQTPNGAKGWKLIFGRHRLRAFEILGWVDLVEGVHFTVLQMSEQQALLAEIEENLAGGKHTAFARAVMVAAYRAAAAADGLLLGRGGDRKSADYQARKGEGLAALQAGFTAHAMETFDLSRDQVERLVRIGTELTKPPGLADRLHFSRIARNQSQLLKLAALPEEQLARAAEAFDAAEGDFFNLMSILSQAPAAQAKLLGKLKAGTPLKEVVGEEPEKAPAFNHWQQAVSSYSQLDFKGRVAATIEHFKADEKAVRAAVESLGYRLVKVAE